VPAVCRRYHRVAVAGAAAFSVAGDAASSWRACQVGRRALHLEPDVGWCGRIDTGGSLSDLAIAAAMPAWATVRDRGGVPALAAATSKGDLAALGRVLAGDVRAWTESWPGRLDGVLARALAIPLYLPAAAAAACATGLTSVLAAADLIESGACTHALAGAADRSLTPLLLAGYRALGVLCGDRMPVAFAAGHGFAPAEGAGFIALADAGTWRLVAGVRLADAGHATAFADPCTLAELLAALWRAAPHPDLIVCHATGTAVGDRTEIAGLAAGPWSSCARMAMKPLLGHCLGASSAVELAVALHAPVARLWQYSLGFGGHAVGVALDRSESGSVLP